MLPLISPRAARALVTGLLCLGVVAPGLAELDLKVTLERGYFDHEMNPGDSLPFEVEVRNASTCPDCVCRNLLVTVELRDLDGNVLDQKSEARDELGLGEEFLYTDSLTIPPTTRALYLVSATVSPSDGDVYVEDNTASYVINTFGEGAEEGFVVLKPTYHERMVNPTIIPVEFLGSTWRYGGGDQIDMHLYRDGRPFVTVGYREAINLDGGDVYFSIGGNIILANGGGIILYNESSTAAKPKAWISFGYREPGLVTYAETVVTVAPGERAEFHAHCDRFEFIREIQEVFSNATVHGWRVLFPEVDASDAVYMFDVPDDAVAGDHRFYNYAQLDSVNYFTPLTIRVLGSRIYTGSADLAFPDVSVGDTSSADIRVSNSGNLDLVITDFALPDPHMALVEDLPVTIEPRDYTWINVSYMPAAGGQVIGFMDIVSNDPATPLHQVAVAARAIPLTYEAVALVTEPEVPVGEPVTVLVSPDPGVHLETGRVLYRSALAGGTFHTAELAGMGQDFVGAIPGAGVTEGGVEYYYEMENSGFTSLDPPGAPDAGVHVLDVAAPTVVVSSAAPTSGPEYLTGRDVAVTSYLEQGAVFADGRLHFRQGGAETYETAPLSDQGAVLVAAVPATHVGERGFDYWVEVHTVSGTLTDPPVDPAEFPRHVQTRVVGLAEPGPVLEATYRLVSLPVWYPAEFQGTFVDMLESQPEFGPYNPRRWRNLRYDPDDRTYRELGGAVVDPVLILAPGRGYWLTCTTAALIEIDPVPAYSTPADVPFVVELQPGWNQIGNPFGFPVAWDAVTVDGVPVTDDGVMVEAPVSWSPATRSYPDERSATLQPFVGYWIMNFTDPPTPLTLSIPPHEAGPGTTPAPPDPAGAWAVTVDVSCEDLSVRGNRFGMHPAAISGRDRSDRAAVPRPPGSSLAVRFLAETDDGLAWDYRDPAAGHTWRLAVDVSDVAPRSEVELSWSGLDAVPADLQIQLVDTRLARRIDLRRQSSYTYVLPASTTAEPRFAILVGDDDYLANGPGSDVTTPGRTCLTGNWPNPFNPSTIVGYELAAPGRMSLRIYDIRGRLVATLCEEHGEPGRYEALWQGRDERGRGVPSGTYFARLVTADGVQEARKLVLMK